MKILFNSKFLPHNPGSFAEGPYRIEAFLSQTEEVDRDGEAYITLVHSEAHLERVRSTCIDPGRIPADADRSQQVESEEHKGSEALKNREQIDNRHVVSSSTHQ